MSQIRKTIRASIPILDRSFDPGSHESYYLVWFMVLANLFLTLIAILDIFFLQLHEGVRIIESLFGFIFLTEFLLRMVFVSVPGGKIYSFGNFVSLLVIGSLFAPHLTGNLAILRFFRGLRAAQKFNEMKNLYKRREKTKLEHDKLRRYEEWLS